MSASLPLALILSGCGVYDGSEITEAVGLLVAASERGLAVECFAPDRMATSTHHLNGEDGEPRHLLAEAARIARGKIQPLSAFSVERYAAVLMAGGFGAVKNFSDFLTAGADAQLQPDIAAVLNACFAARKPVAAVCAAPLVVARAAHLAGLTGARVTLGDNCSYAGMVDAARSWGVEPVVAAVDEAVIDERNRIVTVPAYMYGEATSAEVFSAMRSAIQAVEQLLSAA